MGIFFRQVLNDYLPNNSYSEKHQKNQCLGGKNKQEYCWGKENLYESSCGDGF